MPMHVRSLVSCAVTFALVGGPRAAAAQDVGRGPHTAFLFARYDTWSARALYVGYGEGPWDGIFALVQNPRTGYREALLGIARAIALAPHQALTVAVAAADASDSRYGQVYIVPSLAGGPLRLSGTAEFYVPLESQGAFQYYLSPVSLRAAVHPGLEIGATYVLAGQVHTPTGHALGPSISVAVPHGSVTLDWVVGLAAYSTETRLSFHATW